MEGGLQAEHAGGADEDVETTEGGHGLVDGLLHIGFHRDVGKGEHRALSEGDDVLRRLPPLILQDIGDDDVAPLFGQTQGDGPAQSAGAPGDDGGATFLGRGEAQIGQGGVLFWDCWRGEPGME